MKRFFLILMLSAYFFHCYGQLSVKGNFIKLSEIEGVDLVVLYSQIDNSSEIHFKSPNQALLFAGLCFQKG